MSVRFLLQISYGAHHKYERFVTTSVALVGTIFGPWNLDFFRALYPAECISPDITNLQSYVIDGVIGLYPLLMLALLYALVALRDCGCKLALNIHYLLSRFRSRFNLRSSLIGTFATFYILSYMKIAIAGLQILTPTRMWNPNGTHAWVVYSDPSVAYFSPCHMAYGVVTLLLALLVVIFPTFLLFYPFTWFQKLLHYFNLRSLALNTFIDSFQGCYKDGTNGTGDYRYFAAFQLVLRLTLSISFSCTSESIVSVYLATLAVGVYITSFILCRPYKNEVYNKTDIPLLMVLLLAGVQLNISVLLSAYNDSLEWIEPCIFFICTAVPLLYLIIWLGLHVKLIFSHRTWCRRHTTTYEQLSPCTE